MNHLTVLSCCLMLLLSGCGFLSQFLPKDTCTQGDTMSNIRAAPGFDASLATPTFQILWDAGTEKGAGLPSSYFAKVRVDTRTTEQVKALITSVAATAEREMSITFGSLGEYITASKEITFVLEFPDRREFISCKHPGMVDEYLLKVTLSFDSSGQFEKATFEQDKLLGAI